MRSSIPLCVALLAFAFAGSATAQSNLFTPSTLTQADLTTDQSRYLSNLESMPTYVSSFLVTAETSVLAGDEVRFDVSSTDAISIQKESSALREGLDMSWYGANEATLSTASLVVRQGNITGTIRSGNELYIVRPLTDGLHAVVLLDENRFVDHEPEWEEVENQPNSLPRDFESSNAAGGTPIIYVLVPYTPMAAGQVADIEALVQLAIDETNQAYTNSDITPRVALAHTFETTQNGSGSYATDVPRLANTSDGWYDEVHALRDTHGADLVVLITRDYGSSCGRAFTILADDATEGFAAASQACATGYYTFGHEMGHLQGARHNPETDPTNTPFAYGHGKYWSTGSWRTTMSYNCPSGCTRVQQWSNPDVNYSGTPTGDTTTRDNARVLDETADFIADFRDDPIPVELVSFNATIDGTNVTLDWATSSETNNAGFEVQLRSETEWETLGFVEGNGTTTEAHTYTYSVQNLAPGTYEARLRQIDFDGTFEYSQQVEVTVGTPGTHVLTDAYPNPFNPQSVFSLTVANTQHVDIDLFNVLGQKVATLFAGEMEADQTQIFTIDGTNLPSGSYFYRVAGRNFAETGNVTLIK